MRGPIAYLDSSAMVKRYVREPGSDRVKDLYLKAYSGETILSYSLWNIGEVLGALDRAASIGRLDSKAYSTARRRFLLETRRLARLGLLIIVPLRISVLRESWRLLEKHHIYEADALQIASAKYIGATYFITGDKRLSEIASIEKLNSIYLS